MAVFGYNWFPGVKNSSVLYVIEGLIYVHVFALIVYVLFAIVGWIQKIASRDKQVEETEGLLEAEEEEKNENEAKAKKD